MDKEQMIESIVEMLRGMYLEDIAFIHAFASKFVRKKRIS